MTEVIGPPVAYGHHAPHAALYRAHCRCAAWLALVDLLGALVGFLVLMLVVMHLPVVMR